MAESRCALGGAQNRCVKLFHNMTVRTVLIGVFYVATGSWSKDEAEALRQCVLEMAFISGLLLEDTESGIPWATISAKLGNVRGPAQCRIKWYNTFFVLALGYRLAEYQSGTHQDRRHVAYSPVETQNEVERK
jgi:hypothetical protein